MEPFSGTITIDDLDVSGIGLHDLRNKIAIIPQEPVMFVGTIRSNLDPFNKCTDEEIWRALDAVFLGAKLRSSPSKLETAVSENGKSVSQGQRQLLCIARAILSKVIQLFLRCGSDFAFLYYIVRLKYWFWMRQRHHWTLKLI